MVISVYYGLLFLATVIGVAYGYIFSEAFFPSDKAAWVEHLLNILKLFWLFPLPYAILNFFAFVRYPVFVRKAPPPTTDLPGVRLYFRIVTRGTNPMLVAQTVEGAKKAIGDILPEDAWRIEVVTDSELALDDLNTYVITVPPDYETTKKTRYKGRALHYALSASTARDRDWIIHLDEETHFDSDTVRAIQHFAAQQHYAVLGGKQRYPKIGQGVILYGNLQVKNWITTLADSLRVGDDFGRFRLQYEHGKAYFGIHGSFIVINAGLERMVGFDNGPMSSITEDAYFAMQAQNKGVEFAFIHAHMYERSPFSIRDFMAQRRRWFGGLWLCTLAPDIPIKERAIMATFMIMWSVSWVCLAMVYINLIYPTGTPVWIAICGGISFLYYVTLYLIGFSRTFDRRTQGMRYYRLLAMQILLIPLFSVMESAGVVYGILSPPTDFYIVQKED